MYQRALAGDRVLRDEAEARKPAVADQCRQLDSMTLQWAPFPLTSSRDRGKETGENVGMQCLKVRLEVNGWKSTHPFKSKHPVCIG